MFVFDGYKNTPGARVLISWHNYTIFFLKNQSAKRTNVRNFEKIIKNSSRNTEKPCVDKEF